MRPCEWWSEICLPTRRTVHGQVNDGSAGGHHAMVTFAFLFYYDTFFFFFVNGHLFNIEHRTFSVFFISACTLYSIICAKLTTKSMTTSHVKPRELYGMSVTYTATTTPLTPHRSGHGFPHLPGALVNGGGGCKALNEFVI